MRNSYSLLLAVLISLTLAVSGCSNETESDQANNQASDQVTDQASNQATNDKPTGSFVEQGSAISRLTQALIGSEPITEAQQDTPEEHAAKHADPNYVCPMHPQIQQGEPGSCPICGMDLVVKDMKASKGDDLPVVNVSASTAQSMGVRTGKVRYRKMARSVNAVGYVQYNEDQVHHMHARSAGWIKGAQVTSVGDVVEQGQLLAHYYSPDIYTAQNDYLTALRAANDRQRQIDVRTRLQTLEVPDSVMRTLEQEARITNDIPITAQMSGVITNIGAVEGSYVSPGSVMYSIADLSSVWVIVDVFPEQAFWLSNKASATLTIDALPYGEWEGQVDYVYPELDPTTRTLKVRLKFPNTKGRLKPNMFAHAKISSPPVFGVVSVPREAVIPTGDGYRVVKVTEDDHYQPVTVKLGLKTDTHVEIIRGLELGDQIVLSGQFLIDSESNLQASFQRMAQ